jgi:ABC-type molybdate transport system permease subunit
MAEWEAVVLTIELAATTVAVLLVIGTPLAYWLAFTRTRLKPAIEAVVALPLVLPPTVLGFAHTLGEFGVVLMVGGNIPGETRVISIAIYEAVESLNYREAHVLSAGLLAFSFLVLLAVYFLNQRLPLAGRMR